MFKNSLFTVHTFSKSPYFTDFLQKKTNFHRSHYPLSPFTLPPFHRSHYPLSPFTLCPIFLFHRSHYNLKDTIKNYHK